MQMDSVSLDNRYKQRLRLHVCVHVVVEIAGLVYIGKYGPKTDFRHAERWQRAHGSVEVRIYDPSVVHFYSC
jgi:hypothetical protein